jgi:hypothetical protein
MAWIITDPTATHVPMAAQEIPLGAPSVSTPAGGANEVAFHRPARNVSTI